MGTNGKIISISLNGVELGRIHPFTFKPDYTMMPIGDLKMALTRSIEKEMYEESALIREELKKRKE